LRPIRIAAGALGKNAETLVSPQHRMLLSGWRAELLFSETEVLATARSLVNDSTITVAQDVNEITYFHLLFDAHEIVMADSAWSESFHPAALGMGTASDATRDEVLTLFPELEGSAAQHTARPALSDKDVAVLVS
ncbi:MAG: Hint domain-containing protein, partial [Pseudomonadota bacterium]